jgi:two-component system, cell cycle response regulator
MDTTVLIIDDSETVRDHVRHILEKHGVFTEYLSVADAIEGFKLLLSRPVQLVLCDLEMPGFDGYKFLSLKESRPELHELPVIILTGTEDVRSKVKGLEAGASDYLTKPFYEEELVARVRVHLKVKALQDELREKNQRLEELSRTDALTKVANRRHLMEVLEHELSRAQRYAATFAYVMADIDLFKALNDKYGHLVGDEALAAVAAVLRRTLRMHDTVGRFGGEEFGLVLPHTDLQGAVAVAERCRVGIEQLAIPSEAGQVSMTTSFGVAAFPHPEANSVAVLIRLADDALYEAKRTGRNRVVAAA